MRIKVLRLLRLFKVIIAIRSFSLVLSFLSWLLFKVWRTRYNSARLRLNHFLLAKSFFIRCICAEKNSFSCHHSWGFCLMAFWISLIFILLTLSACSFCDSTTIYNHLNECLLMARTLIIIINIFNPEINLHHICEGWYWFFLKTSDKFKFRVENLVNKQ